MRAIRGVGKAHVPSRWSLWHCLSSHNYQCPLEQGNVRIHQFSTRPKFTFLLIGSHMYILQCYAASAQQLTSGLPSCHTKTRYHTSCMFFGSPVQPRLLQLNRKFDVAYSCECCNNCAHCSIHAGTCPGCVQCSPEHGAALLPTNSAASIDITYRLDDIAQLQLCLHQAQ